MRGPRGAAYDAALRRSGRDDMPDPDVSPKVKLEDLLCELLSGPELQRARDILHSIDLIEAEDEEAESDDDDADEQELREQRRRTMAKVADFLSKKNLSEDQIKESLRDFPVNGLEDLGGALDEDLDQLMEERRRRLASDGRHRQQAFDRRFPQARRLAGTLLESSYGVRPERPVGAGSASTFERFPEARRIGIA